MAIARTPSYTFNARPLGPNAAPAAAQPAPGRRAFPPAGPATGLGGADIGRLTYQFGDQFNAYQGGQKSRVMEAYERAGAEAGRVGGSGGVARRALLRAAGATEAERTGNDLMAQQQQLDLQAQGLRLNNLVAGENRRQFDTDLIERGRQFDADLGLRTELGRGELTLGRNRLSEDARQFNADLEFRQGVASEGRRQFDMEYGLNRDRLSEDTRQFDADLGFRQGVANENIRQFDLDYRLDRDRFAEDSRQFDAELGYRQGVANENSRQFDTDTQENRVQQFTNILSSLGINAYEYPEVFEAIRTGDYAAIEDALQGVLGNLGASNPGRVSQAGSQPGSSATDPDAPFSVPPINRPPNDYYRPRPGNRPGVITRGF